MDNQTTDWDDQSFRYVNSYLDGHLRNVDFDLFLEFLPLGFKPDKILDVGCGNGLFLEGLLKTLNGLSGVGLEPSRKAIDLLKEKYKENINLSFQEGSAHKMPFESETFDIVTVWSVLCWVGRNEYLQALGELTRVTKKYLIVMDFAPAEDYKTPYTHKEGFFTYKQDFEIPLLASGVFSKIAEKRWICENYEKEINKVISKKDLIPFRGNYINWGARKLVIFEKNHQLLPTFQESDFK